MPLAWNEIRKRAIEFSNEWKDETREKSESQTFWNEFFNIFGISRRRVASFEKPVDKKGNQHGSIDLFWKGELVVEHKSAGENLDKAYSQALDYFQGLEEEELPRYVIVSDFQRFRIYDLDEDNEFELSLGELHKKIHLFEFILGYTKKSYEDEDPVNIQAAELMGRLHDILQANGYSGHALEIFLVRLMFCLFADDTGIFEKGNFTFCIDKKTREDGSDTGMFLTQVFQVLNTPSEQRQTNLDEDLAKFPYVNGKLFQEILPIPSLNTSARKILLRCCYFDWAKVSPAIFGSMFQSVMNQEERRDFGAHYTSEKNILKIVNTLFLDGLKKEFNSHKNDKKYLQQMIVHIRKMKFLDPACGCGNFLIISYRELRRLQIKIHKRIRELEGSIHQRVLDVNFDADMDVDSMYGIELHEFPVRVAEVALWLVDHQMNIELSEEFGQYYVRLPLKKSPTIIQGNALRMNWADRIPMNEISYILGNPPFVPKKRRTSEQNEDMRLVCSQIDNYGILDYVCCWYVKSLEYLNKYKIKAAFVSTNSITQGEQVGVLWDYLINDKKVQIHFAHRSFRWFNRARGKAHVFVVIIGFGCFDAKEKRIYDYPTVDSDPIGVKAKNINGYLIDFRNIIIKNISRPLSSAPEIYFGSMSNDAGNFLLTDEQKQNFLKEEPEASKFIKPLISGKEFLHNERRWCLWLVDLSPSEIKKLPKVKERIEKVKQYRLKSKREATRKLAEVPYLFGEIRQPKSDYIFIPRTTSENRKYIPMAFISKDNIANDTACIIPNGTLYHFGVLMSSMHMAWTSQICGRLEGRYRYSNKLVYNNFPWSKNPSEKNIREVEKYVKEVLNVRKGYKDTSLADLYNPLSMPKKLLDAHKKLDRAVDKCYRPSPFSSDLQRVEYLFNQYDKTTQN